MGEFSRTVRYGVLVCVLTAIVRWRRLWLFGLLNSVWLLFSTKHVLRAIARLNRATRPPARA